MTIKQILLSTAQSLRKITDEPHLDAEVLLSFVLKKPKIWLYGHPEKNINKSQEKKLENLVNKRLKGEPMAYLIGHKEFFGLDFKVNRSVLIPCPETELLVEELLSLCEEKVRPHHFFRQLKIADIGTGSGNIAITLAKHLPKAKIYAIDISKQALEVAKKNAKKHGVENQITFLQGNLLKPLPKKVDPVRSRPAKGTATTALGRSASNGVDIIAANLPYIPSQKARHLAHSPLIALNGGRDGLKFYQSLLKNAADYLETNGKIFLEIDPGQTTKIKKLSKKYFPKAKIKVKKDLAGLDRLIIIKT